MGGEPATEALDILVQATVRMRREQDALARTDTAEQLVERARQTLERQQYLRAVKLAAEALALDAANADAPAVMSEALRLYGDECVASAQTRLATREKMTAWWQLNVARAAARARKYEHAAAAAERTLSISEGHTAAWEVLRSALVNVHGAEAAANAQDAASTEDEESTEKTVTVRAPRSKWQALPDAAQKVVSAIRNRFE